MRDSNPRSPASQVHTCFTATQSSTIPKGRITLKLKFMIINEDVTG